MGKGLVCCSISFADVTLNMSADEQDVVDNTGMNSNQNDATANDQIDRNDDNAAVDAANEEDVRVSDEDVGKQEVPESNNESFDAETLKELLQELREQKMTTDTQSKIRDQEIEDLRKENEQLSKKEKARAADDMRTVANSLRDFLKSSKRKSTEVEGAGCDSKTEKKGSGDTNAPRGDEKEAKRRNTEGETFSREELVDLQNTLHKQQKIINSLQESDKRARIEAENHQKEDRSNPAGQAMKRASATPGIPESELKRLKAQTAPEHGAQTASRLGYLDCDPKICDLVDTWAADVKNGKLEMSTMNSMVRALHTTGLNAGPEIGFVKAHSNTVEDPRTNSQTIGWEFGYCLREQNPDMFNRIQDMVNGNNAHDLYKRTVMQFGAPSF